MGHAEKACEEFEPEAGQGSGSVIRRILSWPATATAERGDREADDRRPKGEEHQQAGADRIRVRIRPEAELRENDDG